MIDDCSTVSYVSTPIYLNSWLCYSTVVGVLWHSEALPCAISEAIYLFPSICLLYSGRVWHPKASVGCCSSVLCSFSFGSKCSTIELDPQASFFILANL